MKYVMVSFVSIIVCDLPFFGSHKPSFDPSVFIVAGGLALSIPDHFTPPELDQRE